MDHGRTTLIGPDVAKGDHTHTHTHTHTRTHAHKAITLINTDDSSLNLLHILCQTHYLCRDFNQ